MPLATIKPPATALKSLSVQHLPPVGFVLLLFGPQQHWQGHSFLDLLVMPDLPLWDLLRTPHLPLGMMGGSEVSLVWPPALFGDHL